MGHTTASEPPGALRRGAIADVGAAIAMATGGCGLFAMVEYLATLWFYPGETSLVSKLQLIPLTATLAALLWVVVVLGLVAIALGWRLVGMRRTAGLFDVRPLDRGIRPAVPRLWATLGAALLFVIATQRTAAWAFTRFKEPQLTAAVIAVVALVIIAAVVIVRGQLIRLVGWLARAIAPRLGIANPLGRWRAAAVLAAIKLGGLLAVCWYVLPQSRSYLPVRLIVSAAVIVIGAGLGLRWLPHGGRRSRRRGLAIAGGCLIVMMATLLWWGGDAETKYTAVAGSPALDELIRDVRLVTDIDRDGYGSLLGENDCSPWDASIHPGDAVDLPDDGIDQNCDGRDFSLANLRAATGPNRPIPDQFVRDWNILLLTIDTVRYDHTTFGGYATGPKRRDTTPRLAEFVARSTNFTYAQAPAAGTMASIPAILTSKFFHSGIALDEKRPAGSPPGILPENLLIGEVLKQAGYRTAAIGSHEWWNDWGIEQGIDDYDNSIGAKPDPYRVVADQVTDHALAWISRHQRDKWFLWAHYIDPHGRYVAHPNVVDYGTSEPDLYDAELAWTDQEVGRLFRELARLPSYGNTVIIVTSDHGENMGEHGGTIGTHGYALYKEQTHVPLIFFIPGNPPRQVGGAVTNLDIFPTAMAFAGLDPTKIALEGRSLVPQLFYGVDDRDRVVFAEANAPHKQRAAISQRFRLIYHLANNLFEFYDTEADPAEIRNLAPSKPAEMAPLQRALEEWIERVMYAPNPLFNQSFRKIADVTVDKLPPTVVAVGDQRVGDAIEIVGIQPAAGTRLAPGKVEIEVYFRANRAAPSALRFGLVVWPTTGDGGFMITSNAQRTAVRPTADGLHSADRWQAGELIRERFPITIAKEWTGAVAVGLIVQDPAGERKRPTGTAATNDPMLFVLGTLPLN